MYRLLIFSESHHLLLTLIIAFFLSRRYRDWRLIPICLTFGFLIDIDHWVDHFVCFGLDFDLTKFFQLRSVFECHRVIVPFHGWEFVLPLWLIGRWLGKKKGIRGLEWAVSLSYMGHLFLDHIVFFTTRHPLAYFFTYRLLNNFNLGAFDAF